MLKTSNLWKALAATGTAKLEASAMIDGTEYSTVSSPIVSRALCPSALSVGNCVSATVKFSIPVDAAIPESAQAILRMRFTDGKKTSEWVPAGTFYVDIRKENPVNGRVAVQGFDAMQKAYKPFPVLSGFPKSMRSCVTEIARYMGVQIDSRTWDEMPTGADYVVSLPAADELMIKVLGYIGGCCGGNWIITPLNRLRLVPFLSGGDAESSASGKLQIVGITGSIITGNSVTVTGVSAAASSRQYLAGDSSGGVITISSNPYITQAITDAIREKYSGLVYAPFAIGKGIYDPAVEIGDYVVSRNDVRSILVQETIYCSPAFRGDITAPFPLESSTGQSVSEKIAAVESYSGDLSVQFYNYSNLEAVEIGDGHSGVVVDMDYCAGAGQNVVFHAEIRHSMDTTETGDEEVGWTENDGVISAHYYINGQLVEAYSPLQAETDGTQLLHLMYSFSNGPATTGNFRAEITMAGGTMRIPTGCSRAYIIGQGYTGLMGDWIEEDGLLFVGIESYPDKMMYSPGEALDYTGLRVMAYYGDGTAKDITDDCVLSPEEGTEAEKSETITVNLTYTEDGKIFRDSFDLYVEVPVLLFIDVRALPTTTSYEPGETLDYTGVQVIAVYSDGTEIDVTEDCTFTPPAGTVME